MKHRILLAVAAAAASVLALAGCAGSDPAASDGRVKVVASTNVYGSIAKEIGGSYVDVRSMVASYAQDPHDFQASPQDRLFVQRAGLLIENGAGYDPFLSDLVAAADTKAPLITAAKLSPHYPSDGSLDGFNEHVFYDPAVMKKTADAIASDLAKLDAPHASAYRANAQAFGAGIDKMEADLAAVSAAHKGAGVFVTEPLPLYLAEAAGMTNKTPAAFSEAVEGGRDVPPATLLSSLALIGSGDVKLVITNAQAAGPETTQVIAKATEANVPELKFSELVPDGKTYLTWMQGNVDALAKALG
ncbi:metal ABC transporter solute-binding protein, Zn/Mn family [Microbacterium sp. ASV49]|uniref:Zinc ABC transporter substrate-binding protein n=1 Tax=Microbacterium candidum TaxID=3041922 RepID=A0ABT7MTR3_9MICO|nr:zinc ABC transporter substrate-binding protein [Microbacterium sp. ASV49]MDL9977841.1 zinc ABC transporter substrate-binding protein [Microbacterium sp. ASV49]